MIRQFDELAVEFVRGAVTDVIGVLGEHHHVALDRLVGGDVEGARIRMLSLEWEKPFVFEVDRVDEKDQRRRVQSFV